MFLGEIAGGIIFYIYLKKYTAKKKWNVLIINIINSSVSALQRKYQ